MFIQAAVGEDRVKAALARSRGARHVEGGGHTDEEGGGWYEQRNKPQHSETSGTAINQKFYRNLCDLELLLAPV